MIHASQEDEERSMEDDGLELNVNLGRLQLVY